MAGTYQLAELGSDSSNDEIPPIQNMFAAAKHISELFQAGGHNTAFLGGFAMKCRGSLRETRDVDMAVTANMAEIWGLVERDARLRILTPRLAVGVNKVFVRTGPRWDPECIEDFEVLVDIHESGKRDIPSALNNDERELLSIQLSNDGTTYRFLHLNLFNLLRTKMGSFAGRYKQKDLNDVMYLLDNCANDIRQMPRVPDTDKCMKVLRYMKHYRVVDDALIMQYAELLRLLGDEDAFVRSLLEPLSETEE